MEVIMLREKTKTFFMYSIIPNIITENWGYSYACIIPWHSISVSTKYSKKGDFWKAGCMPNPVQLTYGKVFFGPASSARFQNQV